MGMGERGRRGGGAGSCAHARCSSRAGQRPLPCPLCARTRARQLPRGRSLWQLLDGDRLVVDVGGQAVLGDQQVVGFVPAGAQKGGRGPACEAGCRGVGEGRQAVLRGQEVAADGPARQHTKR